MNNIKDCWVYQYVHISGLSKQQMKWLCMFTVDEFNSLLLDVIPYSVIVNNPKLTIPDCLGLLMKNQGYRIV